MTPLSNVGRIKLQTPHWVHVCGRDDSDYTPCPNMRLTRRRG